MKTLKKTLCLVLAMVMVFGLCVTSASAKLDAYEDKDGITYKEAVDVMTGIGILAGDAGGFRPTDTITRAEAAKIIAYIMIGNAGQADALKATSDPFSDVPASHWAAGYIAYCATSGIIAGMGDGYHPNDNVTGLQFAKMLLAALGYGVNNEYVGTDWAINVSRDALRLSIFAKNTAGANNNPATREECALYAFNAITNVKKVSYSALLGGYITNTDVLGGDASDANKSAKFQGDFKLWDVPADDDAFGRPTGHYWVKDRASNIITATYDDSDKLKATYTTAVTGGDIYDLLGSTIIKEAELQVYVNSDNESVNIPAVEADPEHGIEAAPAVPAAELNDDAENNTLGIKLGSFKKGETKNLNCTGNGVQTYVYQWYEGDDTIVRICVIDTYLAKVTDVEEATGKKDPVTEVEAIKDKDGEDLVTLNDGTFKTDAFEEDEYVLITVSDGDIESMVAAPTVKGEISKFTKNASKISVVADGTTYTAAKDAAGDGDDLTSAAALTKTIVDEKDHVLYVDEYGYLIAVADVDVDSNYVYVAQFGVKNNTSGKLSDKLNLYADVYYADGTNDIVVVKTDDTAEDMSGIADGKFMPPTDIKDEKYGEDAQDDLIGLYILTMEKGKAVLTRPATIAGDVDAKYVAAVVDGNPVTKNNATINDGKANSKTVFFYVYSEYGEDDFKVDVYTGIGAVPKAKTTGESPETTSLDSFVDKDSIIKAMAVENNIDGGEDGDTVYFYLGSDDSGHYDRYLSEVTFYVYTGSRTTEEITCKYKDATAAKDAIEETGRAGFVIVNKKGELEYLDKEEDGAPIEKSKVVYLDNITLGDVNASTLYDDDDTQYALESTTKIVDLREDPAHRIGSINNLVKYADEIDGYGIAIGYNSKDQNNELVYVYIYDAE